MRFFDLIRMSLLNLWRRKLRTFLTVLGVLIGTTSIVVMMSIGIGQREYMENSITNLQSLTNITIQSYGMYGPGGMSDNGGSKAKKLNDEAVREISAIPHVRFVSPVLSTSVFLKKGAYEAQIQIEAYSREYLQDMNWNIVKGEFFLDAEDSDYPLAIGDKVGFQFYNPKGTDFYMFGEENGDPPVDMFEEPVFAIYDTEAYWSSRYSDPNSPPVAAPKKYILQADAVIGPLPGVEWSPYSYSAYTELEAFKEYLKTVFRGKAWPNQPKTKSGRSTGEILYSSLIVKSDDIKNTQDILETVNSMGYQGYSDVQYIQQMQDQAQRSQLLLGGIGAISLIVAAIGIANTMMMSIYERTKEIGVFKVLGCSLGNIRNLFLLESGFIGLIGGIFGVILSYGLSYAINTSTSGEGGGLLGGMMGMGMGMGDGQKLSIIPVELALAALVFGVIVGMLSGLMPALRAMRLSPLEAIRTQ